MLTLMLSLQTRNPKIPELTLMLSIMQEQLGSENVWSLNRLKRRYASVYKSGFRCLHAHLSCSLRPVSGCAPCSKLIAWYAQPVTLQLITVCCLCCRGGLLPPVKRERMFATPQPGQAAAHESILDTLQHSPAAQVWHRRSCTGGFTTGSLRHAKFLPQPRWILGQQGRSSCVPMLVTACRCDAPIGDLLFISPGCRRCACRLRCGTPSPQRRSTAGAAVAAAAAIVVVLSMPPADALSRKAAAAVLAPGAAALAAAAAALHSMAEVAVELPGPPAAAAAAGLARRRRRSSTPQQQLLQSSCRAKLLRWALHQALQLSLRQQRIHTAAAAAPVAAPAAAAAAAARPAAAL